jgi:hypothetical protein
MSRAEFIEALETRQESSAPEMVDHPAHYHADTIEAIAVIEAWSLNFNRGNCVKYLSRAGLKDPAREIEDLQKALWYLKREIERLNRS